MSFSILRKISDCNTSKVITSLARMTAKTGTALDRIREVDIDPEGTFKYILIKVYGGNKDSSITKTVIRGYKRCEFHADIYEEVIAKELAPNNLDAECLGGGRIKHEPREKKMNVYGYSQGFGKADHSLTVDILRRFYNGYTISWSDEGY